jgi:hypothetical protein
MRVNHERIARIMREDNLLAVRHEWLQPVRHRVRGVRIHHNLANRRTLLGPNQLWVAAIQGRILAKQSQNILRELPAGTLDSRL